MTTIDTTSTTWTYTLRGQIASAVHTVGGISGSWAFSWQYDSADRVKQITYPPASSGTETVTYGYDDAWRQQSVCSSSGGCYAQAATYNALNQPMSVTLGNSLRHTFTYSSPLARLSRLQVGTSTTLGSIFDRSYGYDNVANVTSITDNRSGGIAAQTFGYDDRDRLTRWTLGSTTQTYAYDTIGNLTSKAGVSMSYGANANGTGAGPHQARSIGGVTQSYDANGNLTSGMGRTLQWNTENLPTSVTRNSVTETYGYNADSLRFKKVRGTVMTISIEGLWEQTSSGTTQRFYTLNGQVVAIRTNAGSTNTVSYVHGDHLGSISVTTDSTGVAQPRQEFDPWGTVRSGGVSVTSRNYTGQILDDTGLLFYNARYYDPAIGRFISGDTVVPGAPSGTMHGVAVTPLTVDFHETGFRNKLNSESKAPFWFQMNGDARQQHGSPMGPANPQALNRYSYVQNNPLKYTDPTGHTWYLSNDAANFMAGKINELAIHLAMFGAGEVAAAVITEIIKEWAKTGWSKYTHGTEMPWMLQGLAAAAILAVGLGGAVSVDLSVQLAIFANAIATFNNEDGVAIGTTLDGGICFVDRTHGRGDCYYSGLSIGGYLLRSNLPSSMLIGAQPVELGKQTKRWWEGFHFRKDEVWIP